MSKQHLWKKTETDNGPVYGLMVGNVTWLVRKSTVYRGKWRIQLNDMPAGLADSEDEAMELINKEVQRSFE